MEQTLDQISSILPADFFQLEVDLLPSDGELTRKHLLPDYSDFLDEDAFSEVFAGYSARGLYVEAKVYVPFKESHFPEMRKGDSIELFIDTRDLKTAGVPTRFCHHFVILPVAIDEAQSYEITRFRGDDRHELCPPNTVEVEAQFHAKNYAVKIFLPSDCLYGYDPKGFERLGFTYRINRRLGRSQHFALSSEEFSIEQQPSLWATLVMREK